MISGLMLGVLYALMGLGISFIYGVMRMINWSMGEFFMIAGYVQLVFVALLGPSLWLASVPLSLAVIFLVGLLTQRFVLKPTFTTIGERRDEYIVIVTIAISVLLKNLVVVFAGPYIYKVPDYLPSFTVSGVIVSGNRLAAAIVAIAAIVLFFAMLKYTWVGMALRATAQHRFASQTLGVDIWRIDNYAFGIGVTLAGVAGVMLAPVFLVYPESGVVPAIKGFVILVIGGLGSLVGSLVSGILLGLAESLGTALIDPRYREVYGFLLLILILLVRPLGLFGKAEREV
ncbi:MAG: branched-chain amino acid ABC transporter permease [Candidatus Caldarchaeales archaeon]